MTNHYTTDFKLKIVKMILEDSISKHDLERQYKVAKNKDKNIR